MNEVKSPKVIKMAKRCAVERLSKFITWISVVVVMTIGQLFKLDGYYVAIISSTLWFVVPDIVAYVLEIFYKIEHRVDTYR